MGNEDIKTCAELKDFLEDLELKQQEGKLSPIYCTSAMNYIFSLNNVNSLMNDENKEIAKRLWAQAKLKGGQVSDPTFFGF